MQMATRHCYWNDHLQKSEDCLPEVFRELLRPTFISLSERKFLERCIRGTTQNRNGSINALVWARCPRNKHHGPKVTRCAVASFVCHFHSGASSRARVMQRLNLLPGVFTNLASAKKDKRRIRKADRQATEKAS